MDVESQNLFGMCDIPGVQTELGEETALHASCEERARCNAPQCGFQLLSGPGPHPPLVWYPTAAERVRERGRESGETERERERPRDKKTLVICFVKFYY